MKDLPPLPYRHWRDTRTMRGLTTSAIEPGEAWTWCYIDSLFGEAGTEQSYAKARA
jgi:hypothetical protein